MNEIPSPGRVASLHLHPIERGARLQTGESIEVETGKGIVGNPRYFERRNADGELTKRQVSLMERELIDEHATTLGLETISPGEIRSNIETSGVNLISFIGRRVQIGEAILFVYEARTGCAKMDAICNGLRDLTDGNRLGVLAQVERSGRIRVGDEICLVRETVAHYSPDTP